MPFKPGQSGNPRGRKPISSGLALAEAIRAKCHPDIICDLAMRLAADETVSVSDRLASLLPFYDRGYIKPPAVVAAHIEQHTKPQRDLSALPLELRIQMLNALRAQPLLPDGNDET